MNFIIDEAEKETEGSEVAVIEDLQEDEWLKLRSLFYNDFEMDPVIK